MPDTYKKVDVALKGGIHREFNTFQPGGWWTVDGFHTNEMGAFTKFPGLQKDLSVSDPVDGLYQARLGSQTYKFAFAGGRIQRVDPGYEVTLASGFTPGLPVDGRTLSNRFFFMNGTDGNRKVTESLAVKNMGIPAPTTKLTATDGGAGSLTGTYTYRYTYYNSVDLIESDPSPVSDDLTVSGKQINLSGFVNSGDTQVDRIRLYRTVANGAVWLRLDEFVMGPTTYGPDNAPDSNLSAEVRQDNGPPPIAKYVETLNGMLVLAGLQSPNESRVAFTGVLRPESHDIDDVYDLDPEELDVITGLSRYGPAVAAGKRNGLYLGVGVHPAFINWTRTRVTQGPLGNFGMVPYEGYLFYLSEKGPYAFTGIQEQYLGQPIEQIYKTIDLFALSRSTGMFYPNLNLIMWNVTTAGKPQPDFMIVYNVITKEWTTRAIDATWLTTYLDAQSRVKWWVGSTTGVVSTGDVGHSDYGTVVVGELVSRGINFPKVPVENVKNFRHIFLNYEPNGGTTPVTVSYSLDSPNGPFITAGSFTPASGYRTRIDINARGNLLFLKLSVNSTEPLVIKNLAVWGHDLGRIR